MWLQVRGTNSHHNRIDRNDFGLKSDTEPLIAYEGQDGSGQISQYDIIEYNYFHDVGPWVANGKETIRLGLSGLTLSTAIIRYNTMYFRIAMESRKSYRSRAAAIRCASIHSALPRAA